MALQPSCPANCYPDLPTFAFAACPKDQSTHLGQIECLYLASQGFPLDAVTDLAGARVDNTSSAGNAIRKLTGIGSKPAPTDVYLTLTRGQEKLIRRTHTLEFKVYDLSDSNRESLRLLQCGADDLYSLWYETTGGNQYGGLAGLTLKNFRLNEIVPESRDEAIYWTINLTWETPYDAERYNLTTLS